MAELRPTFELLSHLPADDVMRHFGDWLRSGSCPVCGLSTEERIELYLPNERQHLWSPQLIVELRPDANGTRLNGRFGPHPYVWALVVVVGVLLLVDFLVVNESLREIAGLLIDAVILVAAGAALAGVAALATLALMMAPMSSWRI